MKDFDSQRGDQVKTDCSEHDERSHGSADAMEFCTLGAFDEISFVQDPEECGEEEDYGGEEFRCPRDVPAVGGKEVSELLVDGFGDPSSDGAENMDGFRGISELVGQGHQEYSSNPGGHEPAEKRDEKVHRSR